MDHCPQIEMTYHDPIYDPKIDQHESIDVRLRRDMMNDVPDARRDRQFTTMEHSLSAVSRTLCEDSFIDSVLERHTYSLQGARRKGTVSLEALVKRWGIGLETARHTIERTMEMVVRHFHDSGGTRRLKHMYM